MNQTKTTVRVRWMLRKDMPEVLRIEQDSFAFGWTEDDFLRCLRQRNCIGMVAEAGKEVVGFMIYELERYKLHLLNFAVHPAWRRCGAGTRMVEHMKDKLSSHRRCIVLETRESNLESHLFFKAQGFQAVRVLRGFYEDVGEDAYRMEFRLQRSETEEPSVILEGEETA